MGRPRRIQFPGAWYHVFCRAARRNAVFLDDHDRRTFLSLLSELEERFDVEVHVYCLMGNHYHLLLHTRRANLAQAMQWLIGRYTRLFNDRHGYDGALFRGRYRSIVVDTDAYLGELHRYIHRNPLAAGIVDVLASYEWSSYRAYLGRKRPPPWLHTEAKSLLGDGGSYQRFVELGVASQVLEEFYASSPSVDVLGDQEFRDFVVERSRAAPAA